ncbi:adaptor protein MecA [Brevibacillus sp. SIMBA_040]|uniref:adaptor protein MecA n=1 Tax=unclassified Brevibacillus TaxID=2684853 RepID=UPI00397E077D
MKMEILDNRTISIFLNETELSSRGYNHDDHEASLALINHWIEEALLFAESTHDFPAIDMPCRTEVAFVPSQGMYITITLTDHSEEKDEAAPASNLENSTVFFAFRDFEDITRFAAKIRVELRKNGKLYFFKYDYLLLLQESEFALTTNYEDALSIASEYGEKNTDYTVEVVDAYGKIIFEKEAVYEISRLFPCN